ncbi:MAG: hypothetical protein H6907_00750 [Hyphomicrobiales bacterium]|nr:hypothetical protein [Hyphomicrobiales bacterium]
MTAPPERPPGPPARVRYRRVVLALDSSGDGAEALDLIAALAARLGADISGLFVEDIDLLRLAALPGTRVVSTLSRGAGQISPATIERSLRGRMALVRRAMEEAARRRRVSSSFEVRQGRVVTEAVGAAGESDLVVINLARGHVPGGRVQGMGEVAAAFAAGNARALLLLRRGRGSTGR